MSDICMTFAMGVWVQWSDRLHDVSVKSAYLRVYEPTDSVTVAVAKLPASVFDGAGLVRSGPFGLQDEPMGEDAWIAQFDGREFVCPRRPRLRMLEGVLAFHRAYKDIGGDVLVPEKVAQRAAEELKKLLDAEPEQRAQVLTSLWHVPLRWFVAFSPEERELVETSHGTSVRYRTLQAEAAARIRASLEILAETDFGQAVTDDLEEYAEWIDGFEPDTLIELDYGSVSEMFSGAELVLDESAEDVWDALEGLAKDDWELATSAYARVSERWSHPMSVTFSN